MFWKPCAFALENFISWFVNQFLIGQLEEKIDLRVLDEFIDAFPTRHPLQFFEDFEHTPLPTKWFWETEPQGDGIGGEFSFPSDLPQGNSINDHVHGVALLHPQRQETKAMILVHGWITPFHNQSLRVARELLPYGYSTFLLELPYHMRRTPPGHFSGIHLINPDLRILYHAIRQGVADLGKLIDGLHQQGYTRISLCSISMGAQTISMIASMPRYQDLLESLTLIMPSVDIAQTFLHSPIMKQGRQLLQRNNISEDRLRRYLEPLRLTHYRPLLPRDRIILVNARYDRIAYPQPVRQLWHAWDHPRLIEVPHSHVSLYFSWEPFRQLAALLGHLPPKAIPCAHTPSSFPLPSALSASSQALTIPADEPSSTLFPPPLALIGNTPSAGLANTCSPDSPTQTASNQ